MTKREPTVGMTLRVSVRVRDAYAAVADRANLIALRKGESAKVTVQDVLRHRLESLPLLKSKNRSDGD